MFTLVIRMHSIGEVGGQFIRIIVAATKTPIGINPRGITGGANVWFSEPMPVPDDLQELRDKAKI